jgi:hypothetical protein
MRKETAMTAEWAAVLVGALGVLVTSAIAVGGSAWKRLEKRKQAAMARLQIITSRWMPNGLRLEFHYAPEFMHQAVRVQVTVKTPSVRLIPGRPAMNPAPMLSGGYVRWEFDGYYIDGSGPVKLIPADGPDALTGVMFLLPDGTGEWVLREAQIEVAVTAGSRPLLNRTYIVSQVGEGPNTTFAEPPILQPIRLG